MQKQGYYGDIYRKGTSLYKNRPHIGQEILKKQIAKQTRRRERNKENARRGAYVYHDVV